jgi:hypothetical protein
MVKTASVLVATTVLSLSTGARSEGAAQVAQPAASPPAPLTKQQRELARQRFDRGLSLYDAGDFEGALREFQSALELVRHPVVLYNVVLVHAKLNQPVACVKAVEELQRDGLQELDAERRERLMDVYSDQVSRIGRVRVVSNVPNAIVQVDGVDVAADASTGGLQLPAGEHVISTLASGYIPRRMRVSVPPRGEQEVVFTLQPLESTLAHLSVTTDVPDVEVFVDGEFVGRTPFPASLAFSPGTHQVALRRAGYVERTQSVALDPGGEGRLDFTMQLDSSALEREAGTLDLAISEPNSLVSINGLTRGISPKMLRLPLGRHHLSVKSAGFLDYEREVVVAPGSTKVEVVLMPTSEFLKDYQDRAETTRMWGYAGVGSGALVLGGSVGFLIWNQGEKDTAQSNFDEFSGEVRSSPSGMCDDSSCEDRLRLLSDNLSEAENRDVLGWVGMGVGVALAATGGGLLLWGDDPARYSPDESSDVFDSAWLGVTPLGAFAGGRF